MRVVLLMLILSLSACSTTSNTCYLEAIVNPLIIAAQRHIDKNTVIEPSKNCYY